MGRLASKGLEYFSVDTSWEYAMKLIRAKYHLEGVGFMTELWASIYHDNYYRKWDDEAELLFADEIKKDPSWVHEIIAYCFEKKLFDEELFKSKGILTSHGIQKRYFKIALSLGRTYIDYIEGITYPDFMPKNNLPGKADFPPGNRDNLPGNGDKLPGNDDKAKQANSKQYKELASLPLVDNFSEAEKKELYAFALDRARKNPKNRNPSAVAKKIMSDADVLEDFKASRPPPPEPTFPNPRPCPKCSGDFMRYPGQKADERRCSRCGYEVVYDPDVGWIEAKAQSQGNDFEDTG
jgi:hypothetical protein